MAAPALVYLGLVGFPSTYADGWAIPSATDIAFAIGVVGLLGRLVSPAAKAFLLAVAVIDDLGAILVIAVFHTTTFHLLWMAAAAAVVAGLWVMNRRGVASTLAYLAVGLLLWVAVYETGINPTLAGVVVAR